MILYWAVRVRVPMAECAIIHIEDSAATAQVVWYWGLVRDRVLVC